MYENAGLPEDLQKKTLLKQLKISAGKIVEEEPSFTCGGSVN